MISKEKIIVALDVDDLGKLKQHVTQLSSHFNCFKIGLEAMTQFGAPQLVDWIHSQNARVFLDGKFNDIPNTIEKASQAAARLNVFMFNVHASCGPKAIEAAAKHKGQSKLLVVTVLTSMNDQDCQGIFKRNCDDAVIEFSKMAKNCGADGVVCSSKELRLLSSDKTFDDFLKVTPGIRPSFSKLDDQSRTMTPKEAILSGASYLVMGRPILNPPNGMSVFEALEKIEKELQ